MQADLALKSNSKLITKPSKNYWRYYGLKYDPFASNITAQVGVYLSQRWEQYFDLLNYLCQSNNVLLNITGVKGCGKTTFIQQFTSQLGEGVRLCQLIGSSELTSHQLNREMREGFGLPEVSGESLEEKFDAHLANLQHHPQLCLMLIDEAERLPEDTLRVLLYLVRQQSETHMRLHILLVGQKKLKDMLNHLVEREGDREIIHDVILEPFTLEETETYVKQRLIMAGLPAAAPLSRSSLIRIHKLSGGIPEQINSITRQTLIDGIQEHRFNTLFDFIKNRQNQFLGGGVFFIILLVSAFIFARGSHYPTVTPASPTIVHQQKQIEKLTFHPVHMPTVKQVSIAPQTITKKNISHIPLEKILTPQKLQRITKQIITKPKIQLANTKQNAKETKITKKSSITKKMLYSNAEQRLLAENSNNYTLQLIGVSNEQSLKTFIVTNKLAKQAIYYHTYFQGKDWYVLLYGRYASSQEAKAAIQNLPNAVQAEHPWVRTYASVQTSIRKRV